VIFGLLAKLMRNAFINYIHVKFNSAPVFIGVLLATASIACFWTISVFGGFRAVSYCFSLQQYTRRQRYLFFCYFMGGCTVGSILVCANLLFFGPAPLMLLYSDVMSCTGDLFFFVFLVHITNWIHDCDKLKEEEGSFKTKDEDKMTIV
jgi:hypothetical protein